MQSVDADFSDIGVVAKCRCRFPLFLVIDRLEGFIFRLFLATSWNGNINVFIHNPTANETIQINRESKERRYHFATDTPSHIRLYGRYLDIALRGQRDDLLSITVRGQRDDLLSITVRGQRDDL
eukprot:324877_1